MPQLIMNGNKGPWSDRWETIRPLGKGGQGETFLVKSISGLDRLGVLKTLRNNKSRQARGRMEIEVSNLDALSYQGLKVPAVYESNRDLFKQDNIKLYFIMEYIDGETLAESLKARGPLSLDMAAGLILDLGSIISAAHKIGVLHRDLKPANIIVRSIAPPDLVVVDYGLSFNSEDDEAESLTVPGEQFRNEFLALGETNTPGGNKRDSRIDVTALCAVFYFILTGQVPGQIVDGKARPPHRRDGLHSIRHHLSQDDRCTQIEVIFDKGFSLDIEHRFQTCDELLSRLRQVIDAPRDKPEDPKILAARLGELLQLRDRKTQLENHKKGAQQILKFIQEKFLQKYAQAIKPFELSSQPHGFHNDQSFPQDVEKVNVSTMLTVSSRIHGVAREMQVQFGAVGNQTVMLLRCATGIARSGRGMGAGKATMPVVATTEWERLVWFSPQEIPSESEIMTIMERELNKSIDDIYQTILQSGPEQV